MLQRPNRKHGRNNKVAAPKTRWGVLSPPLVMHSAMLAAFLGAVLAAFSATFAHGGEFSKDQRQWWIDHYGLVDARTEPLVARAEEIFSRVAAAADKKGNRIPKLVVIGGKGDPYALTLTDGSVILTLGSLRICYTNTVPETGDSRLAFLIGHELAHLAKDDFWHSNAYAAVSSQQGEADVHRALASQLEKTGGSLDFVKTQELQADSYGILSMTMAGYDPQAIIGRDGTNFFAYWDAQTNGKLASNDALHNSPEARAEFIRTELRLVIDALPRFTQGVQLYQGGTYEVSVTLFESFIEKYPGREVYNNLGLSHYQLAMKLLSECNGREPGFKLPTGLDPTTTAQRLRQTRATEDSAHIQSGSSPAGAQEAGRSFEESETNVRPECLQHASYQANLQAALRFLEDAAKKDAAYLPARINLSTALIRAGDHARAISIATEAVNIDPNSAEAQSNKATAEYLFRRASGADDPAGSGRDGGAGQPDRFWVAFFADTGNFSTGPSIVWWPAERYGLQVSYGQGTFTSYAVRGLARFDAIWRIVPYVGLGYLSVSSETDVFGVSTRLSGTGGEFSAGAVLPISKRFSLLSAVAVNNVKLEKTVSVQGQDFPVNMTYSPLTVTVAIVYAFR